MKKKPKHYDDPRAYVPAGKHSWNEFADYLKNAGFFVVREQDTVSEIFDPAIKKNWRFHDEYEFWYIEYPEILDSTKPHKHDLARERGFKPWENLQLAPPPQRSDE